MARLRKPHELMTVGEVAQMFRVDPKTVVRWEKNGGLQSAFRTPGGQRRYRRADVLAVIAATAEPRAEHMERVL